MLNANPNGRLRIRFLLGMFLVVPTSLGRAQTTFVRLDSRWSGDSSMHSVSDLKLSGDGTTVGASWDSDLLFFSYASRLRIGGTAEWLSPHAPRSVAGLSRDGSSVVGNSVVTRGVVWDAAGVESVLPRLPGAVGDPRAVAINGNGTVIVGDSPNFTNGDSVAVRWDHGIPTELHTPAGRAPESVAVGVSGNGNIAVGMYTSDVDFVQSLPAMWTGSDLPVLLGRVGVDEGVATDVSFSGDTVVGRLNQQVFRWTSFTGLTIVGTESANPVVSADGAVVAFNQSIWTADLGTRSIRTVLANSGIDLSEWTTLTITDIADDGRTLVGVGHRASEAPGFNDGWIATIPAPGVPVLVLFGGCVTSRRRRDSLVTATARKDHA